MTDPVVDAQRSRAIEASRAREMRRLFALARPYNLSRAERLEYASMMFGRDVTSWSRLSIHEVRVLADGLKAAAVVFTLLKLRRSPNSPG